MMQMQSMDGVLSKQLEGEIPQGIARVIGMHHFSTPNLNPTQNQPLFQLSFFIVTYAILSVREGSHLESTLPVKSACMCQDIAGHRSAKKSLVRASTSLARMSSRRPGSVDKLRRQTSMANKSLAETAS